MERAAFVEVGNLCSEISDHRAFSAPSPGIARMYGSWMERELAIHQIFRNSMALPFMLLSLVMSHPVRLA